MKQEEINRGNLLIARRITKEPEVLEADLKKGAGVEGLHYHDDWLWIMPVVEWIENEDYGVEIGTWESRIYESEDMEDIIVCGNRNDLSKVMNVWRLVVLFFEHLEEQGL